MKYRNFLLFFININFAHAELHPSEQAAMVDFYNSMCTTGCGWSVNVGIDACNWTGVSCVFGAYPEPEYYDTVDVIYLDQMGLSGAIPSSIGALENLTRLSSQSGNITGPLPLSLFSLSYLEELSLGWNKITGEIPTELYSVTTLRYVRLHSNQMEGEISSQIENLNNIVFFMAGNNNFTGTIPEQVAYSGTLRALDFSNNNLIGEIPSSIVNLPNLEVLTLDGNNLTGSIPFQLSSKPLVYLYLDGNKFDCPIPDYSGWASFDTDYSGNVSCVYPLNGVYKGIIYESHNQ